MSIPLDPCPFCGGTKLNYKDFNIFCLTCYAAGPTKVIEREIVTAWNTRRVKDERGFIGGEKLKAEFDRLVDENKKLRQVIDAAAQSWLALTPGIAWEGGLDAAMRAAVAEIKRLRAAVLAEREACARVMDERMSSLEPRITALDDDAHRGEHIRRERDELVTELMSLESFRAAIRARKEG